MRDIVPAVFRCRDHDRELTTEVVAEVRATPATVAGAGFGSGPRRSRLPFRVVVRCPDGPGHDLVFSGTYLP
jgi:hypothetical protein